MAGTPPPPSSASSSSSAASSCSSAASSSSPGQCSPDGVVSRLVEAAAALPERDLDKLAPATVDADLEALETVRRRVEAHQHRLIDLRRRRRVAEHRRRGQRKDQAKRRAQREEREQVRDEIGWGPGEARRATELGEDLEDSEAARRAFDEGQLPARHAALLADTLKHLVGAQRERAETELLERARQEDALTFGRSCRRLLATLDHEEAMAAEQRRHGRRRGRVAATDDGMLAINALLSGIDAETVATAVDAFRRPDVPGHRRSAEQATADAIVELARAALRAGTAPAKHGIRPQVVVGLDYQTILAQAGVAETVWMGPLPFAEVRRLLADCGVSRLLVEPDGLPVEAGPAVRDVPVGLWRGLVRRDGGCIAQGCTIPAHWCDVMHLDEPYRFEGRLSFTNAALGCRTHHRDYDLHGWQITWHDRRPVLHPPGRSSPRPDRGASARHRPSTSTRRPSDTPYPGDRSAPEGAPSAPGAARTPGAAEEPGTAEAPGEAGPPGTAGSPGASARGRAPRAGPPTQRDSTSRWTRSRRPMTDPANPTLFDNGGPPVDDQGPSP